MSRVRPHHVIGSAVIRFTDDSGRYEVIGRFNPAGVDFQRRFDAGEAVSPGRFQMAEPGDPEFEQWESPTERASIAMFVERARGILALMQRGQGPQRGTS